MKALQQKLVIKLFCSRMALLSKVLWYCNLLSPIPRSELKYFGIFPLEMLKVEQSDGHCTESVSCNSDYFHDAVFLQETTALTAMRQTVQILHKMKSVILSTILDQYPQCHLGVCEVYDAAVPLSADLKRGRNIGCRKFSWGFWCLPWKQSQDIWSWWCTDLEPPRLQINLL